MHTIDLRSDTVTRPTAAMRAAMLAAPVGDDVFGDDPTVNALQNKIAAMLGFEAALFTPTGTQSNLCGILAHCQRGDEYIVGQMAHTYRWEGGGVAVLGSVQPQPLAHAPDGTLPLGEIEAAIKPDDAHFAKSRLLCLENTIGGKLLPLDYVQAATQLAKSKGLMTHLDGARLFNAAVAQAAQQSLVARQANSNSGHSQGSASPNSPNTIASPGPHNDARVSPHTDPRAEARRIAQCFDSASICFSKGLGAPVGSALCGSKDFIARAHRIRKMAGGGMRQAGFLAAAAAYALDHHIDRLTDDHALAARLGTALARIPGAVVDPVHSNIVFVDFQGAAKVKAAGLLDHLQQHGILATGIYRMRFVTHLDVDAAGVDRAIDVIERYFAA
jgi:threonine aldolase